MTDYAPLTPIPFTELFTGALERFGVREQETPHSNNRCRVLTDGNNYLWVSADDRGFVANFTRYWPNGVPNKILAAIAELFDTDIVSEYEPEFWGFKTQEEWDAAETRLAEKHEAHFYEQLMRYVRGEPHDLEPGTLGMEWAENAKALIAKNPDLGRPELKKQLLQAARESDSGVVITLSDSDIAWCNALMTHEDDLPQG